MASALAGITPALVATGVAKAASAAATDKPSTHIFRISSSLTDNRRQRRVVFRLQLFKFLASFVPRPRGGSFQLISRFTQTSPRQIVKKTDNVICHSGRTGSLAAHESQRLTRRLAPTIADF
jgi:hypothetical protein